MIKASAEIRLPTLGSCETNHFPIIKPPAADRRITQIKTPPDSHPAGF